MFKQIKEEVSTGFTLLRWGIFAVILTVVLSALYLLAWPKLRDLWFSGFRSSNEYITTKQSMLIDLMLQHEKLDVKIAELSTDPQNNSLVQGLISQQAAIVTRMKKEAALIDPDQVPSDVQRFLILNP